MLVIITIIYIQWNSKVLNNQKYVIYKIIHNRAVMWDPCRVSDSGYKESDMWFSYFHIHIYLIYTVISHCSLCRKESVYLVKKFLFSTKVCSISFLQFNKLVSTELVAIEPCCWFVIFCLKCSDTLLLIIE